MASVQSVAGDMPANGPMPLPSNLTKEQVQATLTVRSLPFMFFHFS